jgi:hypothetical protein
MLRRRDRHGARSASSESTLASSSSA